ncbi:hypothetical protein AB1N83_011531 [Pleurotus pulmonarius]
MSGLPNDVLSYIVETVHNVDTQWALLTVCRQMSRLILASIYRDLSFTHDDFLEPFNGRNDPKYVLVLTKLTLGAASNPNLRYTTSFYFNGATSHDKTNHLIRAVLPFLVNLRRLGLTCPYVSPETLSPIIPTTTKLTHLILGTTHYSPSFVNLIESHPTLRVIRVYLTDRQPSGSRQQTYEGPISINAIPHIASITVPIESVKQLGHRPTVTDACLLIAIDEPLSVEALDEVAELLPSLRAVHIPEFDDLSITASLLHRLASVEYLRLDCPYGQTAPPDWSLLSMTKLKYLQLGDISEVGEPEDVARSIFDAIGTMVLVDLDRVEHDMLLRFCRHSRTGCRVELPTPKWQPWRETVQENVEGACLNHEHVGLPSE